MDVFDYMINAHNYTAWFREHLYANQWRSERDRGEIRICYAGICMDYGLLTSY